MGKCQFRDELVVAKAINVGLDKVCNVLFNLSHLIKLDWASFFNLYLTLVYEDKF